MREDMYKVIVERPRRGGGWDRNAGRHYRNSEEVPSKVGIKKGYKSRKSLNENLAPLKRWLESQVNRPWDKVYAELCANIDRRNTVQEHIFTHIENFVDRDVRLYDGELFVKRWWGGELMLIEESRATLYVHPVTGILRHNKHRITRVERNRRNRAQVKAKRDEKRRDLNEGEQLHCIEGIWYHVVVARMDAAISKVDGVTGSERFYYPQHWDAVRHQTVSRYPNGGDGSPTSEATFGRRNVYAVSKRQLSNAELKRYKLKNEAKENAGDSRRFVLDFAQDREVFPRNLNSLSTIGCGIPVSMPPHFLTQLYVRQFLT